MVWRLSVGRNLSSELSVRACDFDFLFAVPLRFEFGLSACHFDLHFVVFHFQLFDGRSVVGTCVGSHWQPD